VLITRTITSAGDPISGVDGTLFTGTLLWSLVDESGSPVAGTDLDGQMVVYKRFPVTCTAGIFSVDLWPVDRDINVRPLQYKCELDDYSLTNTLPTGDGEPLSFPTWILQ
jgi:hypothetical protein